MAKPELLISWTVESAKYRLILRPDKRNEVHSFRLEESFKDGLGVIGWKFVDHINRDPNSPDLVIAHILAMALLQLTKTGYGMVDVATIIAPKAG